MRFVNGACCCFCGHGILADLYRLESSEAVHLEEFMLQATGWLCTDPADCVRRRDDMEAA
jgi:hypothetical protein